MLRTMSSVISDQGPAPIKDLSPRPSGPAVVVDHGIGFELVLSLRMWADVEDPSSYTAGNAWFERIRELASTDLLADVQRYCGGHELLFGHLLGLVIDSKPPHDGAALIDRVEGLEAWRLRRHLLGYHLQAYRSGVPRQLIARAARGDRAAAATLLERSDDEHAPAYRHLMSLPTDAAKDLLLRVLDGWSTSVLEATEELSALLNQSAEAAQRLAAELPFDRVLDLLAPGCRYDPEPGIDRMLLIPSWVGRPWLVMCEHDGAKIFCFPASGERTGDPDAPPAEMVRVHRALGDESRLRLLRRLATGTSTLQELADHLGLAKSTVHAHLLALRTSGVIALDVTDRRFSLRTAAIDGARVTLDTYLGRDHG
jgi:DNA-binding transcriptional ArsR family regulator